MNEVNCTDNKKIKRCNALRLLHPTALMNCLQDGTVKNWMPIEFLFSSES